LSHLLFSKHLFIMALIQRNNPQGPQFKIM
jgi:hypothetical protein